MMNSKMEKKISKSNTNSVELPLPPDLIQLILSKLPFVNLPNCRLVCKAWNNLVLTCKFHPSNLFFAHISPYCNLHCVDFNLEGMSSVAKFSFHPDLSCGNISILDSCNGLLCCSFYHETTKSKIPRLGEVCILNPMTNEYFKPPIWGDKGKKHYYYGFGFSPKTKQYKLARLSFVHDKHASLVEILAFGTSRKWTRVGFVPCSFGIGDPGVYFNGGLYWVGSRWIDQNQTHTYVLFRLDIGDEKFQEIPFPQRGGYIFSIEVFDGTLCLIYHIQSFVFGVWKMEANFSWTKAFDLVIPKEYSYPKPFKIQPIRAYEDGKILCLFSRHDLILYDPRTARMESVTREDHHIMVHLIDAVNFDSLHNILA